MLVNFNLWPRRIIGVVAAGCALFSVALLADEPPGWPQASGPHGNYHVDRAAPTRWSVAKNENILWRMPLPEGGQSSVIVSDQCLFVTCHAAWLGDADPTAEPMGSDVVGYCIDKPTGETLWSIELPGSRPMKYAGIFSDSTSPSPLVDGQHVWFFNASGRMGCWDLFGKEVWSRSWTPRSRHHNRQCEPIMFRDTILFVEVLNKEGADIGMHKDLPPGVDPRQYWTYLHGIDKSTGDLKWVCKEGTAVHNTPAIGKLADGRSAILHGRGGGHAPLEKPYGLTLSSLEKGHEGETIWSYVIPRGGSHYTSTWDERFVVWFDGLDHIVLDSTTGELLRRRSLSEDATVTMFNAEKQGYRTLAAQSVAIGKGKKGPPSTNMSNLLVGDWHYFMTHELHYIGRVNVKDDRVEYLQMPIQIVREPGRQDRLIWQEADMIPNDTKNSRGVDIGLVDKRSKRSGWGHVSAAPPVVAGGNVYFSSMTGLTYVIDADAPLLDQTAIVAINDLGPAGQTWSLSPPSFDGDRIYARTMKEIVCISADATR